MKISGFRGFIIVWLGQFVSIFGSALTRFAITVWIYQETGSATALANAAFFAMAPAFILLPLGGALADRVDRKKVMICADMIGGFSTAVLLTLLLAGKLEIWHLYITNALLAAAEAFQYPAFIAATAMIVPKEHFSRANGMRDLAGSASRIFAPLVAAGLLAVLDVSNIMVIDLVTFAVAILSLLVVVIPQPEKSEEGVKAQTSLAQDVAYGFKFIWERPSLLGLQSILLVANLFYTMTSIVVPAMVLSRMDNNEFVLGSLQSIMSAGALVGGLTISAWGGTKRKMHTVLCCQILTALLGRMWFGLGHDLLSWIPGAFFLYFFIPISNGSTGAIWMSKTPPDVQGRVLATRRFAAQISTPLAALLAGPLAEKVFEPAMMPGGGLAPVFGGLVGTGVGAGISLMIFFAGVLVFFTSLLIYFIPAIWNVEDILPDYIPDSTSHIPAKEVHSGGKEAEGEPAPAD
jgi:MFS family permease